MSLISSLYTSLSGMSLAEVELSVASDNIANADKAGYTRKEYEASYYTSDAGVVAVGGTVESIVLDPYLLEIVINDTSEASSAATISTYLTRYAESVGSVDGDGTVSADLDALMTALDALAVTPEDASLKAQVVADAESLASELRDLSDSVQTLRSDADQEIEDAVSDINQSLEKLEALNAAIVQAEAIGESTADLEDERNTELASIAEKVSVDYYVDGDNNLNIYVAGYPLLTSSGARTLDYTASTSMNSSVTYPDTLSGITLNGTDITDSINSGEIGALLEIRDETLVEEQEKLDELAEVLMTQLNTLLNEGASIPAREDIIGDVSGLAGADTLTATGTMRIAMTDEDGVVVSLVDLDLSSYGTVDALIADINTQFGGDITASLTADGELQLTSTVTDVGISISEMDSAVGTDSVGVSSYFGLNNMFAGTGAEDIQVSDYLQDSSEYLATARLSEDAALAVGDAGMYVGDGDLAQDMNDAFSTSYSFAAAGNFASQSQTLSSYSDMIIANIASQASNALDDSETATFLLSQTTSELTSLTGVNVDEELTNVIDLEARYQAAATLVSVIQEMFDTLIASVR